MPLFGRAVRQVEHSSVGRPQQGDGGADRFVVRVRREDEDAIFTGLSPGRIGTTPVDDARAMQPLESIKRTKGPSREKNLQCPVVRNYTQEPPPQARSANTLARFANDVALATT